MKSIIATHRIILLLALVTVSLLGIWSEKIPVNNQSGWDGKHYANLTIHFDSLFTSHQIDSYQYQRVLTPALLHYTAKLFSFQLSTQNIVSVFAWYNFVLIIGIALLFFRTVQFLQLNLSTEIIGFCALFANVMVLKNTPYYPVLTDTTAFFAGMCITYFYITNRSVVLLIITAIGICCYPLLFVVSLPLALNIRNNFISTLLNRYSVFNILACIIIAFIGIGFYKILWVPGTLLEKYTMQLNLSLLPLSIALVLFYIWKVYTSFNKIAIPDERFPPKSVLFKCLFLIVWWMGISNLIAQISIPEEVFTPTVFMHNILQQSIDNPLAFLLAHITYLGPGMILVLLFYKRLAAEISSYGDSAIAYFLMASTLALGSESRQFIHVFPFIICMLMVTLNKLSITLRQALCFGFICLLSSKFWFPINTPESFVDYNYTSFPNQLYFMNHGPFMSDLSYLINLVIAIFSVGCVYLIFRQSVQRKKADIQPASS